MSLSTTAAQSLPAAHSLLDLHKLIPPLNSSATPSLVSRSQQQCPDASGPGNATDQTHPSQPSSENVGSVHHSPVSKKLTPPPSPVRPVTTNSTALSSSATTPPLSASSSPLPPPPPPPPLPAQSLASASAGATSTSKSPRSPQKSHSFWQTVLSSPPSSSLSSPTFTPEASLHFHPSSQRPPPPPQLSSNRYSSETPHLQHLSQISQLYHPNNARCEPRAPQRLRDKRQERTHDGAGAIDDMNIACVECGVRFRKPGHLNMHWRSVHARNLHTPLTGVPPGPTLQTGSQDDNHATFPAANNVFPYSTDSGVNPGLHIPSLDAGSPLTYRHPSLASAGSICNDPGSFSRSTQILPASVSAPVQLGDASRGKRDVGYDKPHLAATNGVHDKILNVMGSLMHNDKHNNNKTNNNTTDFLPIPSPRSSMCSGDAGMQTNLAVNPKKRKNSGDELGREDKKKKNMKSEEDEEEEDDDNGVGSSAYGGAAGNSKSCRAYKCPQCDASFRRGSDRNRHMRMVHAKIRPFECGICGNLFGRKSFLEAHVLTVHQKLRPFRCDCGAAFGQRSSLTRHSRKIHGREP